jgi:hypothetical protein
VKEIGAIEVVNTPTPAIKDDGRVRLGLMSPSFPPVRSTPRNAADNGQVRMGLMSPSFPLGRAR